MTHIALLEDNPDLREELLFQLKRCGYQATGLACGRELERHLAEHPCRLLILDLGLPDIDGMALSQRLRASHPGLGQVMLTARGALDDKVQGLQQGADAYLVKPTPLAELLATLASVLRRLDGDAAERVDGWRYHAANRTLTAPNGRQLHLTHAEHKVMSAMLRRAPEPAHRRELAEALGADYLHYDERRLETLISRLRRKLSGIAPQHNPILAARGVGYGFSEPCQPL
ncbi:DNA-binding response OmpR family regulator [Chromobacterium alkanivorans]|uniref:response regulator transcription factor n=1 Tax=Chromobacterium TaxID=535 RepID=UPI00069FBF87|nr:MULTISPECIES: response regulator transcription factor [Chromobacterium]MBN3006440.1 response regulator transcription factor [Chromobacterium alkanivorans]MCS3805204.1 DNA-binding response OmpR family regulator [Chromobacterium alkanivorans]MCS3819233.1 DNA-binding response OmpR family regulator [Chromobacterium alkanivorans]MCS3873745.1 DNA-binding response OmpR family regulator [Chromobacterium alkanivorans]